LTKALLILKAIHINIVNQLTGWLFLPWKYFNHIIFFSWISLICLLCEQITTYKNGIKSNNLDEMAECTEGAISQGAGDYFQTIRTLQVPIPQQN